MDIIQSIRALLNRLPILIMFPTIAGLITGYLVITAPKEFISESQIATGFTNTNSYSLIEERFSPVRADIKFNNLMEIINSPILIGALSYHLLLHDLTKEEPFSQFELEKPDNWTIDEYGMTKDSIINILRDNIYSFEILSSFNYRDKKILEIIWNYGYSNQSLRETLDISRINYTDYISIAAFSENPYLSAFIVNTLSEEFLRYNNTLRYSQSSESIDFLETLAKQKRDILDAKADSLRLYKSRNRFLNFNLESQSKIAQVKETEAQREAVLNNIRRINLSLESIDNRVAEQGTSSDLRVLRNRLAELNERRRNSNENYSQLSDSILTVRARLDNLVNNSAALDADLLEDRYDLNVELKVEEEKLKSIANRLYRLQRDVSSFASSEATIASMQRDVDLASQEYLEVQEKLNDAVNANLSTKDNISIVVYGQPAIQAQSSGAILKSGFAFFGTLMICIIGILLIDFMDSRIKTVFRYKQMVDLPLLGSIDNGKRPSKIRKLINSKILKDQIALTKDHAIRKLRYEITSQPGRVILFTSLKPGEGKSFVINELANSIGLMGKRLLIIDTNFRNNSFFKKKVEGNAKQLQNARFELSSGNGEWVAEENGKLPAIFENHIYAAQQNENVHIIPNKSPKGSPAEILRGKNFSKVLYQLIENNTYDYIFLEGAAINEYSDTLELSEYADRVILIMDANSEFNAEDRNNLKGINYLDGKMMGAILNKTVSNY